jgi:Na+/proline symporter
MHAVVAAAAAAAAAAATTTAAVEKVTVDGVQGSGARLMARGMWMAWTWLGPGSVRMEARETDRSGSGSGAADAE